MGLCGQSPRAAGSNQDVSFQEHDHGNIGRDTVTLHQGGSTADTGQDPAGVGQYSNAYTAISCFRGQDLAWPGEQAETNHAPGPAQVGGLDVMDWEERRRMHLELLARVRQEVAKSQQAEA